MAASARRRSGRSRKRSPNSTADTARGSRRRACRRLRPRFFAFVAAGDEILVSDSVYRPTRRFCDHVLKRLGVKTTYYDPLIGAAIETLITKKTRVVFAESPGSQTFEVQDVPALAKAAHDAGAVMILDNTWATPLYFKPFAHGVDVSIQAATKYLVGHADAMLGVITTTEQAFPPLYRTHEELGLCPGPEDVYLGLRGLAQPRREA